jgi:hypothetical protein
MPIDSPTAWSRALEKAKIEKEALGRQARPTIRDHFTIER